MVCPWRTTTSTPLKTPAVWGNGGEGGGVDAAVNKIFAFFEQGYEGQEKTVADVARKSEAVTAFVLLLPGL